MEALVKQRELIERYTDQPTRMPSELRRQIEDAFGNSEPIALYALSDLDASMRFRPQWVALGLKHIATSSVPSQRGGDVIGPDVQVIPLSRIAKVREKVGLSCHTLQFLGSEGVLLTLRYTHRQARAMGNLKFVIEERLHGREIHSVDADSAYAEASSHAIREAQSAVSRHRYGVILRLLGYLKPYRRMLIFGMLAAVFMTLTLLVPPFVGGALVDRVIRPFEAGQITIDAAWKLGAILLTTLAAIYLLREFFLWIRLRTMSMMGEYVARDLRDELYEHLQKLSLSYFSKKQTGSIISRVSSDSDRIWDFIAFGVVEVSVSILLLIGLSVVLISLDWKLGLMMTLPVPIALSAIYLHGKRMQKLFLRAFRKWSDLTDVLSDTIPGIRVVKAFHQENREKKRFKDRNRSCVNEFDQIHIAWTAFWPKLMLAIHVLTLSVWIFGLPRILGLGGAEPTLSAGVFVSFLLYMTMFVQPIEVIGQMARMVNRATSSAYRIFEVLDTEPRVIERPNPIRLDPIEGRVQFENVSFSYDGVRPVVRTMNFTVEPGEMIGIVGPSGSGKTTLINLLARFYEITAGKIRIDGVDLQDLDVGHYRRQIGMVLQDPYLFHGTVLENIRYGLPKASFAEVIEAARMANAHDFICNLPHGYETIVGERGHTLSGGERQRVSIARAVLTNPRILILDEATSAVDTETERKIQEAMDRLVLGRTVFAIAHRLSTLQKANRIFVISDGMLKEEGTHSELLAKDDGIYTKLCRLQQKLHEAHVI